jgi:hypothetical protein
MNLMLVSDLAACVEGFANDAVTKKIVGGMKAVTLFPARRDAGSPRVHAAE